MNRYCENQCQYLHDNWPETVECRVSTPFNELTLNGANIIRIPNCPYEPFDREEADCAEALGEAFSGIGNFIHKKTNRI